jgi:hypothetical protein
VSPSSLGRAAHRFDAGNPAGGLDAAHAGHVEVHDHHIRLQIEAEGDRPP